MGKAKTVVYLIFETTQVVVGIILMFEVVRWQLGHGEPKFNWGGQMAGGMVCFELGLRKLGYWK